MAKGQIRGTKETKKPKTADKKSKVPKYMAGGAITQSAKLPAGSGQKK